MGTVADKLDKLLSTKADIKAAIIEKGQTVADEDTFASYADKVRAIQTGTGTSDATATVTVKNESSAAIDVFVSGERDGIYGRTYWKRYSLAAKSSGVVTLPVWSHLITKIAATTSGSGVIYGFSLLVDYNDNESGTRVPFLASGYYCYLITNSGALSITFGGSGIY